MTEKIGFSTVDEILDDLLKTLSQSFVDAVKTGDVDDFCIKQHFELGLYIRNKYFYQNPAREKLIGSLGDPKDYFLLDGDDFSHLILEKLYERITKINEK